jgi:hypothetical protein
MPNGRGYPDCSYCRHCRAGFLWKLRGRKPFCALHQIELRPLETGWHYRLCADFNPPARCPDRDETFKIHFARFPFPMQPGMLYVYQHHGEEHLRPWMSLKSGEPI